MKRNRKLLRWVPGILMIMTLFWTAMTVDASDSLSEMIIDHAVFQDTSGRALPKAPSISMYSMRSVSDWSYGNQMASENELAMYQALAAVEDMTEYYYTSNSDRKGVTVTLPVPYVCAGTVSTFQSSAGYKMGQQEWNRATHAFLRDDGTQYWISYFAVGVSDYDVMSGTVIINALTFYPIDYYSEIRSELGITEEALNNAISNVRAITGRYNRVKAAHDYVAELVTYNSADVSATYGHTITGGLLEKYGHLGVCECYAKLFRLLCAENGIPCILVTGGDTKDSEGNVIADHMWNYVQMDDGKWYLVDTTWDDQSPAVYDYFLAGSSSQGFYDLVVNDHMPVGCFSSKVIYDPFVMPALAAEAYDKVSSVPVEAILLDAEALSIEVEQSAVLSVAGYLPETVTDGKRVSYSSSNSAVASVNSLGRITANMTGTATITVASRLYPDVKATCEVTVFDHEFGNELITKAATCTETGILTYYCTNEGCSKTKEEIIPAAGHSYGEWQISKEATCTEAGEEKRSCGCGASETRVGEGARGHKAGEWSVIKEASCEEAGSQAKKCTVCGEVLEMEEIPAAGHSYGEWQTSREATCTEAGEEKRSCGCGVSETRVGEGARGHKAGNWTVTKNATGTTTGEQVRKCTACPKVLETKSIAKTFVKLNVTGTIPLQKKKSTAAIKIASQSNGDTVNKWTSSNTKIVKVNAKTGKITAQKKTGTATVTVTLKSGAKASVKIKVQSGKVKTKKLKVSKTTVDLKVKESYTITTTRTPITTAEKITFKSSNKKVASVNSKGKITAKKAGKATITVQSGSKKVKVKVRVKK